MLRKMCFFLAFSLKICTLNLYFPLCILANIQFGLLTNRAIYSLSRFFVLSKSLDIDVPNPTETVVPCTANCWAAVTFYVYEWNVESTILSAE